MDDTIVNSRQKQILELVGQANGLARAEIKAKLGQALPAGRQVSVPTVARDLALLSNLDLIQAQGKGPSTRYVLVGANKLTRYIDADEYFLVDPDERKGVRATFNFDIFDQLGSLFSEVEIKELLGVYRSFEEDTKVLDTDIYKREMERFLIELSWKSAKLEGNTYSILETETLIKERAEAAGHKPDEAVMILNHKTALEMILAQKADYREVSVAQITQLHNALVKDLGVETGIRIQPVGITGTSYKPLDNQWQIQEVMEKLVAHVNGVVHPLEKVVVILAMISYIQPFADGNKRTARMLANAVLMAHNYYPLSYRSVDETYYKKALILFYEQNSLYHVKKIVMDQYRFAVNTYFH
jgi:fido (protein-threonine AMPylation protein)